ncbi:winged helix-turn-helix transcriptional regulator [Dactylosporangium siamense]|uniref:Transcriptional regulator n=1 Tax=Dactylosporangium siamense TaxID=685454 RepID=A0A919UB02_9ACTN|nr:helix-turn-helix domain-containing protein [Dactylosporangium siamense]GIG45056.1 transcriptional regulator [Dactylosporangium siamense]
MAASEPVPAEACYDAFQQGCPSRRLIETIGDKWVSLVVVALGLRGPLRYSELSAQIVGVSQKMLTQTLRGLERDGLITRTVTPTMPVRVDYELTPLGSSLLGVLAHVKDWAERHMGDIEAARSRHDAMAGV